MCKRLRENVYWQDFLGKKVHQHYHGFKIRNICNSKCRICSSFASSQWVAEEIKWNQTAELKNLLTRKVHGTNTNDNFGKTLIIIQNMLENQNFWGEFLIEKGFKILEKCIDKGIAHKICLKLQH